VLLVLTLLLLQASYEEALEYFKQAERIAPGFWKMNLVMLGRTSERLKDTTGAVAFYKVGACALLDHLRGAARRGVPVPVPACMRVTRARARACDDACLSLSLPFSLSLPLSFSLSFSLSLPLSLPLLSRSLSPPLPL
jgi:hypothetical protein